MTSLLFITQSRIGDAVMCTGALEHAIELLGKPEVTIAGGPVAAEILRATPGLKRYHVLNKRALSGHWVELLRAVRGEKFDLAVDMRGTATTLFASAKRRIIYRRTPVIQRKVVEFSAMMGAQHPLAPRLHVDEKARADALAAANVTGPVLALAPGAEFTGKRWPEERFTALAERLARPGGPLAGAKIILRCGPDDRALAERISAALMARGLDVLDLTEKCDLLAYAVVLERATLFVGNDTGPMHIAAAMGAPTLGLFGPTDDRLYAPWGPRARALRGAPLAQVAVRAPLRAAGGILMDDLTVDAVEAGAVALLKGGGLA